MSEVQFSKALTVENIPKRGTCNAVDASVLKPSSVLLTVTRTNESQFIRLFTALTFCDSTSLFSVSLFLISSLEIV